MAEQQEHKENLEREVIKVIKRKDEIVRNVVDKKKCTMVFGMKENMFQQEALETKKRLRT